MHPTCMDWVRGALTAEHVTGKLVLEVGAFDVNGSVRPHVESLHPAAYVGVDVTSGPGVDLVADCEHLTEHVGRAAWDVVISTEMLEHVRDWRRCMLELVAAIVPGGILLVTTRSPGFPYHPFPEDHWRYTNAQMRGILDALGMQVLAVDDDPNPGVFALARRGTATVPATCLDDLSVEGVL